MRIAAALLMSAALVPFSAAAQTPRVVEALTIPGTTTNGVAVRADGKVFLVLAKQPGENVPQIAMLENGKLVPFPNAEWNSWKPGDDPTHKFVHANALRFDPEGQLWVVDGGAEDIGKPAIAKAAKLVEIDTRSGQVKRVIPIGMTKPTSFPDDLRFNGDAAYVTDAGAPGLFTVHVPDGAVHRVLDGDPAMTAQRPARGSGRELRTPEGKPVFVHADQLEISPDGRTLYFQPVCGPMAAIDTQYLDDRTLNDAALHRHIRPFADTHTTGGTAIDAAGNLYVSDTDTPSILRYTPKGERSVVATDARFQWVDAMYITADGRLWLPAAQLDLSAGMNGGKNAQHLPGKVYTLQIGAKPPLNDHR